MQAETTRHYARALSKETGLWNILTTLNGPFTADMLQSASAKLGALVVDIDLEGNPGYVILLERIIEMAKKAGRGAEAEDAHLEDIGTKCVRALHPEKTIDTYVLAQHQLHFYLETGWLRSGAGFLAGFLANRYFKSEVADLATLKTGDIERVIFEEQAGGFLQLYAKLKEACQKKWPDGIERMQAIIGGPLSSLIESNLHAS